MNKRIKELIDSYKDILIEYERDYEESDESDVCRYLSGKIDVLRNVIEDLERLAG